MGGYKGPHLKISARKFLWNEDLVSQATCLATPFAFAQIPFFGDENMQSRLALVPSELPPGSSFLSSGLWPGTLGCRGCEQSELTGLAGTRKHCS
jgi:hypothetical protein